MKFRFALLSLVLGLSLAGCSKKPVTETVSPADKPVARTPNPQINADLAQVSKSIEARQYDAAIGSLIALKQTPKTDAEQQAYTRQVQQVNNMLGERAAQGDEQAAQSYRILSRFMIGR